jgi:hypothetical protein
MGAEMSHRFSTASMLLNEVLLLSDSDDPSQSPGLAAAVGSAYWRSGTAGGYLKTGALDTDWDIVPSGIYFNVVDYGATGDGVTDDRAAIQLAIEDAEVIGGTVYFPPGTYLVGKDGANPYSFLIDGVDNLRFLGTGWGGSVIKQSGSAGSGAWDIFRVQGTADTTEWEALTFDQSGLTSPGAGLCHAIHLTDCSIAKVLTSRFTGSVSGAGSYIHTGGVTSKLARLIWIVDCEMRNAYGPCVHFDSGTEIAWLVDSTLVNESTDDDTVLIDDSLDEDIEDIQIKGCRIENNQKYGIRATSGATMQRVQMQGNLILGFVDCTELSRSQFQGNEVYLSVATLTDPVCLFTDCTDIQFQKNIVGRASTCGVGLLAKWDTCVGVQQHGNTWIAEKAGSGLWHALDTKEFQSQGNIADKVTDAGSSTVSACIVESDAVNIDNIQITHDLVIATTGTWLNTVLVKAGAGTIGAVLVAPSLYRDTATGVYFDEDGGGASQFTTFLMVAGGIIDATTAAFACSTTGIYVRIAGNASTFGANGIAGNGDPEGALTARVGSWFHRLDGGAATSFYVKETGTGNTGWAAK